MADRPHTAERIVVVGDGISGLGIAGRLAQSGLPVTVLERSRLGFGSSTRNQGWLYSGAWFAPDQLEIARMCYESLQRTLRLCPECQEPAHDSMVWMITAPQTDPSRWTNAWSSAGIPFESLPAELLRDRIPELATDVVRHAFQLPDRAIRYDLLLRRLAALARESGAEIRGGTQVERLIQVDGGVQGVVTSLGEEITARLVILAGNAAGLSLVPGYGSQQAGRQSDFELVALKAHLVAIRPEVSRWPFCVVDADGLNHMPHAPTSVFGAARWLPVAEPENKRVIAAETDRIWGHVERLFPGVSRADTKTIAWAGTTVQAMYVEQIEPGRVPLPTVIDHAREPERIQNLLTVFPTRASLWMHLAEQTREAVLEKVESRGDHVAAPPWEALADPATPQPAEERRNILLYHCQVCGHVVRREQGLQPPVCCDTVMAEAAESAVRGEPAP